MTPFQAAVSLLTIVMSGVVASVVTSKLNTMRADREFRRKRLEDVFRAVVGFRRQLECGWSPYMSVMTGKIDYNKALDMTIAAGAKEERNLEEAEMLVAIYWPQFDSLLNTLKQIRDDGADLLAEHKRRYKDGNTHDRESFDTLGKLVSRLEAFGTDFHKGVRAEARKLN